MFKSKRLMLSQIVKTIFFLLIGMLVYTLLNEFLKNRDANYINIKINAIDKRTNQLRVNKFDSVIIETEGLGYWVKTFKVTGRYKIDSTGFIKIKINSKKINFINLYGDSVMGTDYYSACKLKENQVIDVLVSDDFKKQFD